MFYGYIENVGAADNHCFEKTEKLSKKEARHILLILSVKVLHQSGTQVILPTRYFITQTDTGNMVFPKTENSGLTPTLKILK